MTLVKDYGFVVLMFGFPMFLRYILSIALEYDVSWSNYINNGEILNSIFIIFGYLFTEILLLIYIPGKFSSSEVPRYKINGISCFFANLIITSIFWPYLPWIYLHFVDIIMTLEWLAWILCIFLYIKGHLSPTFGSPRYSSGNIFKDFVVGIEQYPAIKDYQLKQIFNCRFGMMSWSTIIICCLAYQQQTHGYISNSLLISSILQLTYITKFFWWEDGYFNTMDIAYDYFGFYIAWGVTYAVPGFYTYNSIYLANRPIYLSYEQCLFYIALGLIAIYINYEADYQKMLVRRNNKANIWCRPAKVLEVKYGNNKQTVLCLSGWWGVSRHFHYIPELLTCLAWALPCGFESFYPYLYFSYLSILLFHRIQRDEWKCSEKYGEYYQEYKRIVPYKLIPWIY
jgi:7-dehydrocholesterol reductase